MDMRRRWLSFALAGLAAGWIAATFFSSPLVALASWRVPVWAALCGALSFAVAGAALDRPPTVRSPAEHVRLLTAVLAAGALAGGAVGLIVSLQQTWRADRVALNVGVGCALGALAAIVLLPGFAVLSGVSAEGGSARAGSLAVRTERRRAWSVLTGFVAVALLASLPDWLAYGSGQAPAPWEADVVAAVLAVGAVALAALEVLGLRRVARLERAQAAMEPVADAPAAVAGRCQSFVDLGVGEHLAGTRIRSSPYRAVERLGAVVYGDARLTRTVLVAGLSRAATCLLVIGGVVTCQRLTALPSAALWFQQQRCSGGSASGCYQAWAITRGQRISSAEGDRPALQAQEEQLLALACDHGIGLRVCDTRNENPAEPVELSDRSP
jgi:hypothetical protein